MKRNRDKKAVSRDGEMGNIWEKVDKAEEQANSVARCKRGKISFSFEKDVYLETFFHWRDNLKCKRFKMIFPRTIQEKATSFSSQNLSQQFNTVYINLIQWLLRKLLSFWFNIVMFGGKESNGFGEKRGLFKLLYDDFSYTQRYFRWGYQKLILKYSNNRGHILQIYCATGSQIPKFYLKSEYVRTLHFTCAEN